MAVWERLDAVTEVQQYLPWATVLDVFQGQGWTAISLEDCGAPLSSPVKYFVKARLLEHSPCNRPRLLVALQRTDGSLSIVRGERVALVTSGLEGFADVIEI